MKIFFVMRHAMYLRNFESTIRELLGRGHEVVVACLEGGGAAARPALVDELTAMHRGCSYRAIAERMDRWRPPLLLLRHAIDYVRYLDSRYANAPKLTARARSNLPGPVASWLDRAARRQPGGWAAVAARLRALERVVPPDPAIVAELRQASPDVVVVTPLVDPSSSEIEYLKAAVHLGLQSAYPVASWDNLTNKGMVQGQPGVVAVWNEFKRREAIELHGLAPDRIVVTGAPLYDQWFAMRPSSSRAAFAERVGLPARQPSILYLCSSGFIAEDEVGFVRRWLAALRLDGNEALRGAPVLIRPHPANALQWTNVRFDSDGPVSVWPRAGAHPIDATSKANYFDSLYHCEAVVGLNTSGLIEAGIVGRPVLTILDSGFADTQGGTLHFRYLTEQGLLTVASSLPEHTAQLAAAIARDDEAAESRRRFIQAFIRPRGIDQPATPLLADAIERVADGPPVAVASLPAVSSFWRATLIPVAWICAIAYRFRREGRAEAR